MEPLWNVLKALRGEFAHLWETLRDKLNRDSGKKGRKQIGCEVFIGAYKGTCKRLCRSQLVAVEALLRGYGGFRHGLCRSSREAFWLSLGAIVKDSVARRERLLGFSGTF